MGGFILESPSAMGRKVKTGLRGRVAVLLAWTGGAALALVGGAFIVAFAGDALWAIVSPTPASRLPGEALPSGAMGQKAANSLAPRYVGAITEGLERPLAVAAAPGGDVYVADGICRCVRVYDQDFRLRITLGPETRDGEEMGYPTALALEEDGTLLVSDLSAGRVHVFREGVYGGRLDMGEMGDAILAPAGIALHGGRVYINDLARHQVLVFDRQTGETLDRVGLGRGDGQGYLEYPNYALPLEDGSVLVADSNNNRLQLFPASGEAPTGWPGPLLLPRGMARDSAGNTHVASLLTGRIEVFDARGRYVGGYAMLPGGPEGFGFPIGVAVQGDTMYVAEQAEGRVQAGMWERTERTDQ